MRFKNLKVYSKQNKKYNLVRVMSGAVAPILLSSMLAGCIPNTNRYDYHSDNSYYNDYSDFQNDDMNSNYSSKFDDNTNSVNNEANNNTEIFINNNENSNTNINLTLDLDKYSLGIVNSKVKLDSNSLDAFIKYVNGINVVYPYSELYGMQLAFNKYNQLGKYISNATNLFVNNQITGDIIYSIVKKNNQEADLVEKQKMSDSNLKEICNIMSMVLNNYAKNRSQQELILISEKINDLKILKFDDFSNGYYDAMTGKMGLNVTYLKGKSNDFFKKTVEHETYHFIQANTLRELSQTNIADRYGISYKFNNLDVNPLSWNWYYEGSAEYLTCNLNNISESEVYGSVIKSMDTIKVATMLSKNNGVQTFENISLSSDLNELFEYFGCNNNDDKIEILNMMYAYNISFNLNFSSDDFFDQCKKVYGTSISKNELNKFIDNSIAQTLTKVFYRDLAELLKNQEVSIKEIFSLISIFENEISRETWYNSRQATLTTFFEMYNNTQTNFFEIIAKKIGISCVDVQQAYNSYNNNVKVDTNEITIIDSEKKDFYKFILNTRKGDKMNSINYVSKKYNSKTR